jgi:hypothetical protein
MRVECGLRYLLDLKADAFDRLNCVEHAFRKQRKCTQYLLVLGGRNLAEEYSNGRFSIILDLLIHGDINIEGVFSPNRCRTSNHENTRAVFRCNTVNFCDLNQGHQEMMLIGDIETVKQAQQIIPSRIWLDPGYEEVEEGVGGLYFYPCKRGFKFLRSLAERERGAFTNAIPSGQECPNPRIVKSGVQVMDGVTDEKPKAVCKFDSLWQLILDPLNSDFAIQLDSGRGQYPASRRSYRSTPALNATKIIPAAKTSRMAATHHSKN